MNWIKSNPFEALLLGITVVVGGILLFVASQAGSKYVTAKESFDQAYADVSRFESNTIYPRSTTKDAKMKAIEDYRESIEKHRQQYVKYQVEKLENIPTERFTQQLIKANTEVANAFKAARCELPEGFFLGFEKYSNLQAKSDATGILSYQLEGIKHAMLALAKAQPSAVLSVSRDLVHEEESSEPYVALPDAVSRTLGYEVVFKCAEPTAREFLSSLGEMDPHFFVVRCIRVENEKDSPPRVSDAKFEAAPVVDPNPAADALLPDIFQVDGAAEPAADGQDGAPPAPEQPEAAPGQPPVAPPVVADSSRILAQVLGDEELIVFVRFDLTMFLPFKELPKP